MRRTLILPFEVPDPVDRLARLMGIRLLTRQRITGADLARYAGGGASPWIAAHEVLKQALDGLYQDLSHGQPTRLGKTYGIAPDRIAHRLVQQVNISFGFHVLFLLTAQHHFGGDLILPAPAAFRRRLGQAGMSCHPLLSAMAWGWLRLRLQATGLLAHFVHCIHACRDEFRPDRLPEWARSVKIAVWPATDPGAFSSTPDRLSMGDFFKTGAILPFQECAALLVSDADGAPPPPLVKTRHILSARRSQGRNFRSLAAALTAHLPVVTALLGGQWQYVVLARETALLPRARLFANDVRPTWLVGGLPNIASPNLWYELARQFGAKLYIVCNSAQVTSIHQKGEMLPGHVPHIYMHPVADRFGAWTETHARALSRFGIPRAAIDVAGPLIYSARPPRRSLALPGRKIMVDYFDQVPYRPSPIESSGVPSLYWSPDRLIRTVENIITALDQTLPAGSFCLRIKSKKVLPHLDAGYFQALEALAAQNPALRLVEWRTSALTLHSDSDLTISFPFASPSISARWYGVPACYYDVDGLAAVDIMIVDDLPVLTTTENLASWIAAQYSLLSRS